MVDDLETDARKKERSPSFPFISLSKAVERARAMHEKYRKEPVRVTVVGAAWGLGAKSSGLQQTVGALKQYGLVEDSGSREDRKVALTALALRILLDTRPGQRDVALREAAMRPRLFAEYVPRWAGDPPADDHRISELSLERGFGADAAKTFLRVFDDTVRFAGLAMPDDGEPDTEDIASEPIPDFGNPRSVPDFGNASPGTRAGGFVVPPRQPDTNVMADAPFAERLKVEMTVGALRVNAVLTSQDEVDVLLQIIQANKALLPK